MHHLSSGLGLSSDAHRLLDRLGLPTHREGLPARLGLLEQGMNHGQSPQFILKAADLTHPAPHLSKASLQDIGGPNPLPVAERKPVVGPTGLQVSLETLDRRGETLGARSNSTRASSVFAKVGAYKPRVTRGRAASPTSAWDPLGTFSRTLASLWLVQCWRATWGKWASTPASNPPPPSVMTRSGSDSPRRFRSSKRCIQARVDSRLPRATARTARRPSAGTAWVTRTASFSRVPRRTPRRIPSRKR